jgi:hypothetical protein
VNSKKIERATAVLIISVLLTALVLVFTGGCTTARYAQGLPNPTPLTAPSLPEGLRDGHKLLEYYPDASKRAREQGRVVVKLQIGGSGSRRRDSKG